MLWPLVPLAAFLLIALNYGIFRLFRRQSASAMWWIALAAAWLIGGGIGIWSGFFFEYEPRPGVRYLGAPVFAGILKWEGPPGEEHWVDYIAPMPIMFAAANPLILASTLSLLLASAFLLRQFFFSQKA